MQLNFLIEISDKIKKYLKFILPTILLLAFIFFYLQFKKHKISEVLFAEVKSTKNMLNDILNHTERILNIANIQISNNPHNKAHIYDMLRKYMVDSKLSDRFSWTVFSWVNDNDLLTVDAIDNILKKPIDMSDRIYIDKAQFNPKKLILGQAIIGSTSKVWIIPGGVSIKDKNGNYIGSTVIGLELSVLLSKLKTVTKSPDIDITLINQHTKNIVTKNGLKDLHHDNSFQENLTQFINSKKQQIIIPLLTKSFSYAFYRVPNSPYIILITYTTPS